MIVMILQLIVAFCLAVVCFFVGSVWWKWHRYDRDSALRTFARYMHDYLAQGMDFLKREGWEVDTDTHDGRLHSSNGIIYFVMKPHGRGKGGNFRNEMEPLFRGVGGNNRIAIMVAPDHGDGEGLTVERVDELTRYMRWHRATGAIVLTDRSPTFTAKLHASDQRILMIHHRVHEVEL